MKETLIKIDKNGSKHYIRECTCERCSGRGWYATHVCNGQLVPSRIDSAICYECHGSGKVVKKVIERTPEYEAKLEERRRKRAELKEAQHQAELANIRAEWLTSHGFNAEGKTFIFLGDTFSKKDELKEAGAKFDACLGWHIDHELEGFHFITADISEVAKEDYWGYTITASRSECDKKKRLAWRTLNNQKPSEHIGEVGKRMTLKVRYISSASWENEYGCSVWGNDTTYLHKFEDADGNKLVWKTSNNIPHGYGTELTLTGTIKEHSEYDDERQTVLTRCKIAC